MLKTSSFISSIKLSIFNYAVLITLPIQFLLSDINGQEKLAKVLSLDEAVKIALTNHPFAKNSELRIQSVQANKSGGLQLAPTQFSFEYGQTHSELSDHRFIASQNLGSILTHIQREKYYQNQLTIAQNNQQLTLKQLSAAVKEAYFVWVYQFASIKLVKEETDLYDEFLRIANLHFELGESDLLEKTMAETQYAKSQKNLFLAEESLKIITNKLNRAIFSEENYIPAQTELELYAINFQNTHGDKFYPYTFKEHFEQQVNAKNIELAMERSRLFPEISAGYFNQKITPLHNLQGFQVGIAVPLWYFPAKARIKEAAINREIAMNEASVQTYELEQTIDDLKIKLDQEFVNYSYYHENALKQADLIIKTAVTKFKKEEIEYSQYVQSITEALKIKSEFLDCILKYNLLAVELEYYLN